MSRRFSGEIRLLLTDLIMPGMTGRLLADTLLAGRPGLKVVFMSGHAGGSRREALEAGLRYLQKPVDWDRLERMVSEALGKGKRHG